MATPHSDDDSTIYLFTSLTAGSSHIISATSRLETILKANRVPFKAIDIATDDVARRIWTRKAGKRKLPGIVKEGEILGDFPTVEDWNEYGELKMNLGLEGAPPQPVASIPTAGTSKQFETKPGISGGVPTPFTLAMSQKPAAKPAEKAAENPQSTEPAAEQSSEKKVEAVAKVPEDGLKTAELPTEATAEKSTERPAETSTQKAPVEETHAEPTEKIRGTSVEKVAEAAPLTTAEEQNTKITDSTVDKPTSDSSKLTDGMKVSFADDKLAEKIVKDAPKPAADSLSLVDAKAETKEEPSHTDSASSQTAETVAETHRGSSVSTASPEEIEALEKKLSIPEEDEERGPYEPQPTQHRGSSVSVTSNEDIKKQEKELTIPEANEEESDEETESEEDTPPAKTTHSAVSSMIKDASSDESSDEEDDSTDDEKAAEASSTEAKRAKE